MITPQLVFMILGIVLLVAACVLLVVALVYYVRNDIRGVQDDLAGRARRGGGAARNRRTTGRERSAVRRTRPDVGQRPLMDVEAASGIASPSVEDNLDTELDTKLRAVPQRMRGVNSDAYDVNDDIPTLVTSVGDYHQTNMADKSLNEADMPTAVDENEDEVLTIVEQASTGDAPVFVVTKSIVAVHSKEIIAVG